jgi:RimJ/RimL family protein N-acetyltransferase
VVGSTPAGLFPSYPLRTERLDLRPHREDDLDDLLGFHSLPEVVRYVPWPVRDREQTRAALQVKLAQGALRAPGEWLVLAMELRETGRVVGEVLLKWASDVSRQGELGFALHPDAQGRGLAEEAAQAVLRLGFEELGLHRISAVCIAGNDRSARLLTRLGMRQEGHLRDSVLFKGAWEDQLLFSVLDTEWRARTATAPESAAGPGHVNGGEADEADESASHDLAEIARLVATFFAAFTTGPDVDVRLDSLRQVLLPQAIILRSAGDELTVYDVDGFIAPRRAVLTDGTLQEFREWEVVGRTEMTGGIAQRFSSYAKAGVQDGTAFSAQGTKTLQLVRTSDGWRISAVAWTDDPG